MKLITFIVILFQLSLGDDSNEDEIDDYVNLITTEREEAENYQVPTDNEQYRPKHSFTEELGHWDFIIVGAGAGGSVVANRLSEERRWKILLLEAGGPESNFSIIPANHLYLHLSKFNWGYYSTPQKHSCLGMRENRCPVVRGRALGGSTILNYEAYVRGNKDDFDGWAAQGNPGWTYRECLPYFIKSENSQVESDPGYHGRNGYWNNKYVYPLNNQSAAFIEGGKILHNFTSTDYNGRNQLGTFRVQVNNRRQFRDSAGAAFLQPIIKKRENLKVLTNAYVTKVLIAPGRKTVHGVIFSRNGKQYCARASKEVIMAAGATNTPQLLMLSGVGPRQHLKEMNIPVVRDLPVGKTLYDHALFYAAYLGINVPTPNVTLRQQVKEFLNDYGPLTQYSNIQVVGFYRSKYGASPIYPDIEMMLTLVLSSLETFLVPFLRLRNETYQAITDSLTFPGHINVFQFVVQTASVGSVTLQSKDPYKFPIIDPNFLAEQYDVEILYQAVEILKEIIDTEPLRKLNATLILVDYPQCRNHDLGSKDYWICAFRLMTGSSYHQSGTCRMGPDPKTSVVSNKGIVHGFQNLRVVDISIFPSIVAGHTAAPTIMLAEKISDYIKIQYGVAIEPITNAIY